MADTNSQHGDGTAHAAFGLLARGVQEQLWQMGWMELRPIQVEAIQIILRTSADCVISAETASGKTEAAFLPVLSEVSSAPLGSVRALYVGPLRALINDQFSRMEQLCSRIDVPTHRWHGDVDASNKKKLLSSPGGVLLITPESLESLFINHASRLAALFGGLQFVVIDELHAFLGNERGMHLASLLARLNRVTGLSGGSFRRIGLSATIGDTKLAQQYLNPLSSDSVELIEDVHGEKEIRLRVHGYSYSEGDSCGEDRNASFARDESEGPEFAAARQIASDLVEHCRTSANLVFLNSRSNIELYADLCKDTAHREGLHSTFLVHHGSLSRDIREDAEHVMKSRTDVTVLCSSTLELGIDIGSVRMVGQVGAPWSVASLKQRLGRSGRRDDDPRIMRIYISSCEPSIDAPIEQRLHLELVQAIAAVELLIARWIEPSSLPRCDLSTLTHQIISVVAESGCVSAIALFERLVMHGAFRDINAKLFKALLHCLGAADVLEQIPTGELILGLEGEKIRGRRDFYAAFASRAEFVVTTGERLIGTVPLTSVPAEGDLLLLAGRRWAVRQVDLDRREILVAPAHGGNPPLFAGTGAPIHPRIRQGMRNVLASSNNYPYVNKTAATLLNRARQTAAESGALTSSLVSPNDQKTLWFTWSGTIVHTTLIAILALEGVSATERGVALEVNCSAEELSSISRSIVAQPPDKHSIAGACPQKVQRKFDWLLDEELLSAAVAEDGLDCAGALSLCAALAQHTA